MVHAWLLSFLLKFSGFMFLFSPYGPSWLITKIFVFWLALQQAMFIEAMLNMSGYIEKLFGMEMLQPNDAGFMIIPVRD